MIIVKETESPIKGKRCKRCILSGESIADTRVDFQALFTAILQDTEITMIFLEELSHIQPKLEERIKDVQNSISDSDRE